MQEQNIQVGAGAIGKEPAPINQSYEFSLRATSRLKNVSEFENLVLKVSPGGTLLKLADVGRVELGAENYSSDAKFTLPGNKPKAAVGLGVYQLPGSNALQVARAVEAQIATLAKSFPPGLKAQVAFDTTPFVEISLEEVLHTLVEAVVLVVLVIFVFLQDWRTTIIPTIAIPVSLIGTCAALLVLGFQINTLTLFGFVLAIGIVVDDAIIVVEAISVKLEQGMQHDIGKLYVRSNNVVTNGVTTNAMIPLSSLVTITPFVGPKTISHYNLYRSKSKGIRQQEPVQAKQSKRWKKSPKPYYPKDLGTNGRERIFRRRLLVVPQG